jgi:Ca-activated chloride channel family protein
MIFDSTLILILAPVFAIAAGIVAWRARSRRVQHARAWSVEAAAMARSYGRWAPVVLGICMLAGSVALAGPRGGRGEVTSKSQALSVVFAIDISRSMLAEDVQANRLDRSIREARRLAQDLDGDRIGLIAFAGRSYILAPLTVDVGAINLFLDALDPDLASQGGTSLGSVLSQARGLLSASEPGADRVLVVFTDGESHDSTPETVSEAKLLKDAGIRLVLVSEGGTKPVRIPLRDSAGTLLEYKLDETGHPVMTSRRDDILQDVADAGEGTVVSADLPDQAGAVRDLLDAFKRTPTASTQASNTIPRGWIPILIAAVILLVHTLTRRHAALVSIAALAVFARPLRAQHESAAERALARGQPAEAATRFLRETARGRSADTAWYNAGTAAMEAGNLDVARRALSEAAKSPDPNLRYRALYNLGVASLLASRSAKDDRDALLKEAGDALRDALLLQPASERAKWNLELTNRQKPPSSGGGNAPPSQGGGGGGQQEGQGGEQESPSALSRREAEQILGSVEREERQTRARHAQRDRTATAPVEKDW